MQEISNAALLLALVISHLMAVAVGLCFMKARAVKYYSVSWDRAQACKVPNVFSHIFLLFDSPILDIWEAKRSIFATMYMLAGMPNFLVE